MLEDTDERQRQNLDTRRAARGRNVDLVRRYKKSLCSLSSCHDDLAGAPLAGVSSISGRFIMFRYILRAGRIANKCTYARSRRWMHTRAYTEIINNAFDGAAARRRSRYISNVACHARESKAITGPFRFSMTIKSAVHAIL